MVRLAYDIDSERHLLTIKGDPATPSEWRALFEQVRSDPKFHHGLALLRDARWTTRVVDVSTIRSLVVVLREMSDVLKLRRMAVVAPRDRDDKAAMLQAVAEDEGVPLQAFRWLDDALRWLEVPDQRIEGGTGR